MVAEMHAVQISYLVVKNIGDGRFLSQSKLDAESDPNTNVQNVIQQR